MAIGHMRRHGGGSLNLQFWLAGSSGKGLLGSRGRLSSSDLRIGSRCGGLQCWLSSLRSKPSRLGKVENMHPAGGPSSSASSASLFTIGLGRGTGLVALEVGNSLVPTISREWKAGGEV